MTTLQEAIETFYALDEAAPHNSFVRRLAKGVASYRHARRSGLGRAQSAVAGVARAFGMSGRGTRKAVKRTAAKEGAKPTFQRQVKTPKRRPLRSVKKAPAAAPARKTSAAKAKKPPQRRPLKTTKKAKK